ncbi:hypothetical protein CH379_010445 [Leptospira ellisii]|uniref:SRPBCC family protein n=1 Tax=Leptospira ellisii TaxID=2023197 RepID=A0A2N0BDF3_9LEPT|nr:hypothetical protein [Leptospira ellisii]MDV6236041.1 hypothetical protein [Leptospira ellisii]PJZ94505.1 hypothetical protein CH379_02355 [Leptospira ellisii]PKA02801.1 hypothetical protein CH375_20795 [Leptospira ellisii]
MITTTVTFLVSHSLDESFRFVADFRNLTRWGDRIKLVNPLPAQNDPELPCFELLYSFGPFELKANYSATEWKTNSRMIMETSNSFLDLRDIYTFQKTDHGAKITFTNHSKLRFPYSSWERFFHAGIRARICKEMRQLQNCLYREGSKAPKHFHIIRN